MGSSLGGGGAGALDLRFWDELSPAECHQLVQQIEKLNLPLIQRLMAGHEDHEDWEALLRRAEPPVAFRLADPTNPFSVAEAREAAEQALSAGRLGVILVAGGQGTRLGFDHPKGMYSLGPVSGRTLFQMHVDQLRAVSRRYGSSLPLYVMTSPATHEETVAYFSQNDRFGLDPAELHFFCQGTMPAVDDRGRLLLADRGQIFFSPDGHGGMLAAIAQSGCLRDAIQRGIDQLFYLQVDNPLVRICDRELIGYHLLAESEMSTQVVAKRDPLDKVGNVVSVDGGLRVVEYSDLPPEAGQRRQEDGSLRFWAGSIAIHVFSVPFLERCVRSEESLPFHRARKKVATVSEEGHPISPDQPNATKFERFIFDLMPLAHNAIVVEADEHEVFAPLKNASGAEKDTPESTRQAIVDRARRWLAAAGVEVVPGTRVEIHPDYALDYEDLVGKLSPGVAIDQDTFFS